MEVLLWNLLWCFQMQLLSGFEIFQRQRPIPRIRTLKTKDSPSLSSSSAFTSTSAPTPELDWMDLEGSEPAIDFLYSGDVPSLSQANCSQRFELRDLEEGPVETVHSFVRGAMDTLVQAANFLNMIFQTSDIRESSVREDVEWYHALVRSSIEGDPKIYRVLLTFDAHPMSSKPQLMLQATKETNEILLQEVSMASGKLRNLSWDNEWFTSLKFQKAPSLHKTILSNDLKSLDTPKWNKGDSYVINSSHIKLSPPFLECTDNKFVPSWMVTLSSAFYGLKPDLSPEFKGVFRLDVKLQTMDINQCDGSTQWFADTHQCDLNSTECIPQENIGFVLGKYLCLCKPGFYSTAQTGLKNSSHYGAENASGLLQCHPCQEGCKTCVDDTPCLVQEDWSLRITVLSFQTFCMLAIFLSMLISYYFRSSKRIKASGVLLLETILFGSLLLYFPVFILYFKPSVFRCIVLRWVRMLGFTIVYGTITLKLYRVLKVFLSRTAQRVPYMTTGRVLRMLGVILLLVFWFLAAWTIGMLENIDRNIPLVVRSQTPAGLEFFICDHDCWDYMMVVAELLFLCWGSFLCYAIKTVPSAFHEPRYLGLALHNEMVISTTFHVGRFIMAPSLHPDWTLLLFFIHTHVTVTTTLALIFVPKFLHVGTPLREEIAAEVYEDELDLRHSGSYLNSSITSAWSEHSLDSDDIRDELKKLYAQLEVHKTKRMTANNPHLQKKRSSRRGLGRSIMRRITEIPESVSRQCSREEKDGSTGGGGGSYPGSYKKKAFDSSSSSMKIREEALKNKPLSLRKSHSTYDHVRDQENASPSPSRCLASSSRDASLRDSLMRKKLAKKASQKCKSDLIEDGPLVYKSASAHNLLTEKPLHPKPHTLQKSLSVITSAREKALLLTNKVYDVEESRQAKGEELRKTEGEIAMPDMTLAGKVESHKDDSQVCETAKQQQTSKVLAEPTCSLLKDAYDKAEVCPWEVQDLPSTASEHKVHKHVTYAPIMCGGVDRSHQLGKLQDNDTQSGKYQSRNDTGPAPSHPEDTAPPLKPSKEGCLIQGLCLQETKELPSQTKSMDLHDCSKPELENHETIDPTHHFSPVPINVTPATVQSFPAELCPWEHEVPGIHSSAASSSVELICSNMPDMSLTEDGCKELSRKHTLKGFVLVMRALKGSPLRKGSSKDKRGKESEESEGKHKGSASTQNRGVKKLDMDAAPTDAVEMQQMPKQANEKTYSELLALCPPQNEERNLQNSNSSKMLAICHWEANIKTDIKPDVSSHCKVGRKTERADSADAGKDDITGPRNLSSLIPEKADNIDTKRGEICPWENMEAEETLGQLSKSASTAAIENYKTSKKTDDSDKKRNEICPWETAEVGVCVKADICPWETSKTPSDGKKTKMHKEGIQSTNKENIERTISTEHEENTVPRRLESLNSQHETVCPWEIRDSQHFNKTFNQGRSSPKKSESTDSKRAEICPWENLDAEDLPRTLSKSASDTWDWCRAISKKSSSIDSNREEVCTWRSIDVSVNINNDACPWEMEGKLPIKGCTQQNATEQLTEVKKQTGDD